MLQKTLSLQLASFLSWLDERGIQLETLDQRSVDLFFAHHRSQAAVPTFLNWAIQQNLTRPITPPHRSRTRPATSIPEDPIGRKVDELLDDDCIPPASRIIGLLVLVFAQRISDCVRLRQSDVSDDKTTLSITFGRILAIGVLPHGRNFIEWSNILRVKQGIAVLGN